MYYLVILLCYTIDLTCKYFQPFFLSTNVNNHILLIGTICGIAKLHDILDNTKVLVHL